MLKPNWISHNLKKTDFLCLTTHPNIILAVLEFALELKPKSIIIEDFRNETWEVGKKLQKNCRGNKAYVFYDLTSNNLLEPLLIQEETFRVNGYVHQVTAILANNYSEE